MGEGRYRRQFDLSGRVAVVTGGAGFLGRAFCEAYVEFGADVAVLDIDGKAATDFATALAKSSKRRCLGVACDIADPASVRAAARRVGDALGPVRVLHNNAANQSAGLKAEFAPFEEVDLADWKRVMSVDVDGTFLVCQAFGAAMAKAGQGGSIIQTSSIYGLLGPDNRIYEDATFGGHAISSPAVYSAGKAAMVGLTRWLATYWAKAGIRANAIVPGGVEDKQNETFKRAYGNRIPLGRMARRNELVGAALFLASDASSYVTGQCLFVDGGLSAW
ncbi:MAG: SDR family oxidoreductase [Deltaproteobacteria bacterium]|nr:SDR family oxidoreductase [Deltaproteobacteria bacterium]